jgi:hypothetical protein
MNEDFTLGNKVIAYALSALAWGVSVAIAWSCSSLVMSIIMFIISSLVLGLLAGVLHLVLIMKMDVGTIEGIGRNVGGAAARVTNLFTRKAEAA